MSDDARTWQVFDRRAWLGPMSTATVIERLRDGSIRSDARCRETGVAEVIEAAREPAFAPWCGWPGGRSALLGSGYVAGSWTIWVVTDANMPWSVRLGVAGSVAVMLAFALRSYRRRRALDPIGAQSERILLRFTVAVGLLTQSLQMLAKCRLSAFDRIPLMNGLGALALAVLGCSLLWMWQRRDGGLPIRAA